MKTIKCWEYLYIKPNPKTTAANGEQHLGSKRLSVLRCNGETNRIALDSKT